MTRRKPPTPTKPPILSDQLPRDDITAIETAIADLMTVANSHSYNTGRTPEQDAAAEAYRLDRGPVPALINNPVQLALTTAIRVLKEHAMSTMSESDFVAMIGRVLERASQTPRYAPDNRVKH